MKYFAVLAIILLAGTGLKPAQAVPISIDANIGLQSFVSLTDAHMRALLGDLQQVAVTPATRSGKWTAIESPLRAATTGDVAATIFYAAANGQYWIVGDGLQPRRINDRPYFSQVFAGKTVVGDIVTSRSNARPVAIIAVPVRGADGKVEGLLGAGVDLTKLSALLTEEMGITSGVLFWATDAHGITALHSAKENVSNDALKVPDIANVLRHMIETPSGTETYSFKGKPRTVLYRHSTLTGWTYGFGIIH